MALIQTFNDLRLQVLRHLDEAGDTGTTRALVGDFLNQAHQYRTTCEDWTFMLWDTPETFTTTSGDQLYTLHQEFHRPAYFFNRTTRKYLVEVPMRSLGQTASRWNTDSGPPDRFMFRGKTGIQAQPTSGSVVRIVSSSASDTTAAKAIIVRGVTASGVTTESITPNGLTPVSGTTTFTKILGVQKSADWVGTMTMTTNSAAVTNLVLFPTEYGRSYQQIFLLKCNDTNEIEYQFYRQPTPFVNTYDVPDIPPPHAQILVYDALLMMAGYQTDIMGKSISEWQERQKNMEHAMRNAFLEGQSLDAEPRYIRVMPEEGDFVSYTITG